MRNDNKAENQHYVPKMLLRNFSFPKRKGDYVHVYDKHEKRRFTPELKNIAAERSFYDFDDESLKGMNLESSLTSLENSTAESFARLINARSLTVLNEQDKLWIGIFVATQHLRTKNFRRVTAEIDDKIQEHIRLSGGDIHSVENYIPFENEDHIKQFANYFLISNLREHATLMLIKRWTLYATTLETPFIIGDSPVAMHNHIDMGPYGNIGLALKGIQIYLPLTPTLTLGLLCPSLIDEMREKFNWAKEAYEKAKVASTLAPMQSNLELSARLNKSIEEIAPVLSAWDNGTPVSCNKENMDFFNSLQVRWAERFVLSNTNSFEIVERMLRDNPKYQYGMQIKM